jgi:alpha-amylase
MVEEEAMEGQLVNKINLVFALHNHQPEGNLPDVFSRTFNNAYEPFIRELEAFPEIKVVLHYSGTLFLWLQENRPEFMARLRNLVSSGQVEMMGGAFFEPILVMIPDEDKVGQIKKQNRFIRENFQVDVQGAWLAERIWEPHLARPLHQAGIHYTVLDDSHFHNIGFSEEETLRHYVTEEEGARLLIFPISEKLRYAIPFAEPQETIEYLQKMATPEGERVVVLADDGEKFGSWPGTSELVYQKQWLQRFFRLLRENCRWLTVTTFKDYMERVPPAGRVYLPAGSYREMMEWSGGFWRNFFVRYPESNQIHKKMLHVRKKLSRLPEGQRKKEAMEYLWAGQCNCAYWHGVFGGLYLNFLRSALYSRLIAAEDLADRALHPGGNWLEMEKADYDYDGAEEILLGGPDLGMILSPEAGGSLLELDFKARRFNLLDTLSRRPEAYHCNIFELAQGQCATDEVKTIHHITRVKEAGLENLLVYDNYRRASLIEHFFAPGTTFEQFSESNGTAETGDFVNKPYAVVEATTNGSARVVFSRQGDVGKDEATSTVNVEKTIEYVPQSGEIRYSYQLENLSAQPLETRFAVEFNINFLAGSEPDRYYTFPGHSGDRLLNSRGEVRQVRQFGMVDEWLGITTQFQFNRPTDVWRQPLETVSQSEDGMERVYQGSSIFPNWMIKLNTQDPWRVSFIQKVGELVREVH